MEFAIEHTKPVIALSALATHYILHHGEWDNSLPSVFGAWGLAFSGLFAATYTAQTQGQMHTSGSALRATMHAAVLYFGVLITSILLHRGFFHRLRNVRIIVCIFDVS
jgi:hypothetical protein